MDTLHKGDKDDDDYDDNNNKLLFIRRNKHLICEDNIKMDHQAMGWGGMDWTDLVQDRYSWRALVNSAMNLRVP